jgi:hypothetical protein
MSDSDSITTLTTLDSITITNPNPDAGTYTNVTVMGSTSSMGGAVGDNTFVLGDINYTPGAGITSEGGTVYSLSYSFDFSAGTTSSFLTSSYILGAGAWTITDGPDASGEIDGTSAANANAWTTQYEAWLASLGSGYTLSGELDLTTSVNSHNTGTWDSANYGGGIVATYGGGVTSNEAGHDIILGFQVTSDPTVPHDTISLGSNITEAVFDQYFRVTSSTHQEFNSQNIPHSVNDTTIALADNSWSIDIYNLDTTAYTTDAALHQYLWDYVIAH